MKVILAFLIAGNLSGAVAERPTLTVTPTATPTATPTPYAALAVKRGESVLFKTPVSSTERGVASTRSGDSGTVATIDPMGNWILVLVPRLGFYIKVPAASIPGTVK